jgi:hypothetical protein
MNAAHVHDWTMGRLIWKTAGAYSFMWRCACGAAMPAMGQLSWTIV